MVENLTFSELQKRMQIDKKSKKEIKFTYRNAEDIYNKFKKIDSDWELIASDDLFEICGRLFVKSTVIAQRVVGDTLDKRDATAFSEIDNVPVYKNGNQQMQIPQWTGAVSSYARKYALQGLFAIGEDDVDDLSYDIENNNQSKNHQQQAPQNNQQQLQEPLINNSQLNVINEKIGVLVGLTGAPSKQISSFVLREYDFSDFRQLPISKFDSVINYLDGQIQKRGVNNDRK